MNTQAIVGAAGSGKSTLLKQRIESGEHMLLTSTTGISAVNLGAGVTTINSALGFFDLRDLKRACDRGSVCKKFVQFARRGVKTLVIDEVSMLQGEALQLIHDSAESAERIVTTEPTGILLVADFCQLPPIGDRGPDGKSIQAQYAFEAPCWSCYEQNLTRLTKIWRQDDPRFLSALNLVRQGRSVDAAIDLKRAGVEFSNSQDEQFDGITLFAVNQQVDGFNARRLAQLPGEVVTIPSKRWGKERSEWKNIPECLELKDGALVMILANEPGRFSYVNGDLATFRVDDFLPCNSEPTYSVESKRGYKGSIPFVIRRNVSFNEPDEQALVSIFDQTSWGGKLASIDLESKQWMAIYLDYRGAHQMRGTPYYDPKERGIVIGEVEYMPLRIAYASSIHKCLVESTLVQKVHEGLVPLSQINVGDGLSHDHVVNNVLAINRTEREMCKLTTRDGYEVLCAEDHPFEVRGGDSVALRNLIPNEDEVRLSCGIVSSGHTVNPDLAWVLGALIGHFCSYDSGLQQPLKAILADYDIHVGIRGNGKGAFFTSRNFRNTLLGLGLRYETAHNKRVPHGIFTSSSKSIGSFLQGLYDTAGCVQRSGITLTTMSQHLAKEVQLLLLMLGIPSHRSVHPGITGPYSQVRISAWGVEGFKTKVGLSRTDRMKKLRNLEPKRIIRKFDGYDFVKSIEYLSIVVPMIDVELDGDHLFSANGIVTHNCQGLTLDNVQVDINHYWAGNPSMCYVALTRCRSIPGLRIVGDVGRLARRIKTDARVKKWV